MAQVFFAALHISAKLLPKAPEPVRSEQTKLEVFFPSGCVLANIVPDTIWIVDSK